MYRVLVLGASYGSLLGIKLALAGHTVKLVCQSASARLINSEGAIVRMPVKGCPDMVELDSRRCPGGLTAGVNSEVNPADYDLVVLAMQEPVYGLPGVRELLAAVANSRVPCMSIMNLPPLPYLKRIAGIDVASLAHCYTDASVWDGFDPALMTLCSPDPQAFRPPEEKGNVLQVRLATNFKAARFEDETHTAMLHRLASDIDAVRFDTGSGMVELPVRLRVHDSVYVPLAKWSMLLTGNYRCVQQQSMRPISEAVHGDIEVSRAVYDWVAGLCMNLGAAAQDLVPFEKYAGAARSLSSPSSAARALAAGATRIERVDRLVQSIAAQRGMQLDEVDRTVALVDGWMPAA